MTHEEMVEDLIKRLWAKTVWKGNCLVWQGCVAGKGYGVIGWFGRQVYIHRLIYQLCHPEEDLKVIRHTCDTPRCWYIDHLRNGSTQDNVDDKVAKQRHIFGESCYNTILTDADIVKIRDDCRKLREIAADYGVNYATIHYIRSGKTWRHVA